MMNETQFFRKIYLSHFIRNGMKGLCVRGELETEQRLQHIDPQLFWLLQHFFLVLLGCSTGGPWGPSSQSGAGSHVGILSPKLWLQLTRTSCGTRLYNCLMSTCFLWASHLHPIQPVHSQGYPLISLTGCTCYLHRYISYVRAQLGRRSICYT